MGAIIVLTPIVVAAWPLVASAIFGAAASMGFSVNSSSLQLEKKSSRKSVETDIENSEVVADGMAPGEKIVIQREDLTVEFGQDERGACTVCVSGEKHSEKELKQIGEEMAGRVVQQFAYHKLVTELKKRNFTITDEKMMQDESIQIHIRQSY